MKPSEQSSFFSSRSKWVQIVVCYDWNLQKHKYLSGISMFLHKTFRTGLVSLSQSKWVQIVVCYDQNLQKHKHLSFCMKPQNRARFSAGRNESKEWYATIKTYKNINISVGYQCFCMNSQNRACFSEPVQMSPNSGMLWSKLTKT